MDPKKIDKDYSKLKIEPDLSDKISTQLQNILREQTMYQYQSGLEHLTPKILVANKRLKLYNNQKKNPEAVGDNSLYSLMNTLLAAVYFDNISVRFKGKESGDNEQADNMNYLALYDYDVMKKYIIDYYWAWNALFYGAAPLHMPGMDRNLLVPEVRLIDPLTFIRDPDAALVNPIANIPGLNFWGHITSATIGELKANPAFFNLEGIENEKSFNNKDINQLSSQAKANRDYAQGRNYVSDNPSKRIDVLDWHCHLEIEGKSRKVRAFFAGEDFKKLIRFHILRDSENDYEERWRLVNRQFSPMPMDWDGVSVPDFTEDKQRAKARLLNLTLDNVEETQRPNYVYNEDQITDKKALVNYSFNKFIPTTGVPADVIRPLTKAPVRADIIAYISNAMDEQYQKAAATPAMQQGALASQDRTLGELEMATTGSMNRYKLFSSIFSWSERDFYELYYYIEKNEFQSGIDVKTIRLRSAFGSRTRELRRENLISLVDPDIEIERLSDATQKKMIARTNKIEFFKMAMSHPDADAKSMIKDLGRDFNIETQDLDIFLPPNAFEYQAQEENLELSKNKKVPVNPSDDDDTHLKVHQEATDTPAKNAHIYAHTRQKMLKVTKPELFPGNPQVQGQAQQAANPGQTPPPGQQQGGAPQPMNPGQIPVNAMMNG